MHFLATLRGGGGRPDNGRVKRHTTPSSSHLLQRVCLIPELLVEETVHEIPLLVQLVHLSEQVEGLNKGAGVMENGLLDDM